MMVTCFVGIRVDRGDISVGRKEEISDRTDLEAILKIVEMTEKILRHID